MPDYLSQVQEEEEALGVQYDLEEPHPSGPAPYPGPSGPAPYPRHAPSSTSSIQLPVISQVSSSTGLLSPEPPALPLDARGSPKMADGGAVDGAPEEGVAERGPGAGSSEVLEQEPPPQDTEVAPITIE